MEFGTLPDDMQLISVPTEHDSKEDTALLGGVLWPNTKHFQKVNMPFERQNEGPNTDVLKARETCTAFLKKIMRPLWLPPQWEQKLIAAKNISDGYDAFLMRYRCADWAIQYIVTRLNASITIKNLNSQAGFNTLDDVVAIAVRFFELTAAEIPMNDWVTFDYRSFKCGYIKRTAILKWKDGILYTTDGNAVRFSIRLLSSERKSPPATGSEPNYDMMKNWF